VLHIHRAERADRLVEALGSVLERPLEDPLTPEQVAVPTRGVERWLSQRLAARLGTAGGRTDGICANVTFPFPGRLVGGALAGATGVDRELDPWLAERAVWPLLDVVDEQLGEPWLTPLTAHLRRGDETSRRFAVVRHLADLYDRYGVHRPAMIRAWAGGQDVDDGGQALPADCRWQAILWRHLAARIGAPSPAERLATGCGRLRAERDAADLPARVSLFGLTRLPASFLEVLDALAAHRDVHLFLLHPSPALWRAIAEGPQVPRGPLPRAEDPTTSAARNPLLASWGQDAREMELVVTGTSNPRDHHTPGAPPPDTLLGRIQRAVHGNAVPPGAPWAGPDERPVLAADDDSLQVHACHGRARQVEVLRDAVLHLLDTHPHLEARDVIVMCPDIEAFAPLIHATFGPVGPDDEGGDLPASGTRPPGLRVRLADRSLRQTNPVLRVVADLLTLADSRVTASEVLELAAREPVRRRFAFTDADIERLEDWVPKAGIRWGLDAEHRAPFKLDALGANTWRAGIDRVMAGVAMDESGLRLVGDVLPLDDVGSSDIDLAGRFGELLARLRSAVRALQGPQPVDAWVDALARCTAELTAATGEQAWQQVQLERLLADVGHEAAGGGGSELTLGDARVLFSDRLRGRPTVTSFRTGHLTICTLVPMRSVPHKVVCLLGLDDGAFPRRTRADGDDLLQRDPRVGDRDPRTEDRQLLLDALLAATEHLVVTYAGRDERTNLPRPPSVPVGELLDVIDATVRVEDAAARDRILVHHPLQPFDTRVFTPGALVRDRPWGFDDVALAGARALSADGRDAEPFLAQPLPRVDRDVIEVADLEQFVRHPVKTFLRQRLGVSLAERDDEPADALPVDLDPLERWSVGQRLLDARLAGTPKEACIAAERARGELPPGALGTRVLRMVGRNVDGIVDAAAALLPDLGEAASLEINLRLDDGCALIGTVPGVTGSRLQQVTYSRVAAKHRLTAWVRFLALTATDPERPFTAITLGRGNQVSVAEIASLGDDAATRQERARRHLGALVDLYHRGLREPLPLYCDTSAAYAESVRQGRSGAFAAGKLWASAYQWAAEDSEPEHLLVLGGLRSLEEILEAPPCAGEEGEGWAGDEDTRFGRLARRLWDGLLAVETVTQR
jgi:exodeoxyribonuclease V gamma subunit